ncbi:MAG: hypothetical protein Q4C96_00285 [Planctomycetia bacterium]|nr:hypothetical protein [Planctomycetia bacterium]
MNRKHEILLIAFLMTVVWGLGHSASAQYQRQNYRRSYNNSRVGMSGVQAEKVPAATPAPAGYGANGTVPSASGPAAVPERTVQNVMGNLPGTSAVPSNLNPAVPAAPISGVPASGTGGTVPGNLNPYMPVPNRAGSGNTRGSMPINPYQPTSSKINSVNVQYGARTPSGNVQKPFSEYRQPDSISPWMKLYQRGNNSGIDNYHFYVKPALEAQQKQQQMQQQIRELQVQKNATEIQQQQKSAYGTAFGVLNSGQGASYGFSGVSGAGTSGKKVTVTEAKETQNAENDTKNESLYLPGNFGTMNPYVPSWDTYHSGGGVNSSELP